MLDAMRTGDCIEAHGFLTHVPANARILALAGGWLGESARPL